MQLLKHQKFIVFITVMLTGFSPYAQTIEKQSTVLVKLRDKLHPFELHKMKTDGDSSYYIMFRNDKYSEIVDWQHFSFDVGRLEKFYNGLLAIQNLKADERINLGDCFIQCSGSSCTFFSDGGYVILTKKQVDQLAAAIKPELKK